MITHLRARDMEVSLGTSTLPRTHYRQSIHSKLVVCHMYIFQALGLDEPLTNAMTFEAASPALCQSHKMTVIEQMKRGKETVIHIQMPLSVVEGVTKFMPNIDVENASGIKNEARIVSRKLRLL